MIFKYTFSELVLMLDIEATFMLAIVSTQSIYGESETRLMAEHMMDITKGTCVVDGNTPVGWTLNRLFVGFLTREFGPDSFQIERIDQVAVGGTRSGMEVKP